MRIMTSNTRSPQVGKTDKAAATKESQEILPGGKTKLFDQLSEDKCMVKVRIVGPPLILTNMDDKKSSEYTKFQMSMQDAIIRLAPGLEGLVFDLFTSRKETTDIGFPASIICQVSILPCHYCGNSEWATKYDKDS